MQEKQPLTFEPLTDFVPIPKDLMLSIVRSLPAEAIIGIMMGGILSGGYVGQYAQAHANSSFRVLIDDEPVPKTSDIDIYFPYSHDAVTPIVLSGVKYDASDEKATPPEYLIPNRLADAAMACTNHATLTTNALTFTSATGRPIQFIYSNPCLVADMQSDTTDGIKALNMISKFDFVNCMAFIRFDKTAGVYQGQMHREFINSCKHKTPMYNPDTGITKHTSLYRLFRQLSKQRVSCDGTTLKCLAEITHHMPQVSLEAAEAMMNATS